MARTPSPNGDNGRGRDARGRFTAGNPGGPGNPHAGAVAAWREALLLTVSPADLKAVIRALLKHAKAGEPWAVKELLDRCLGRAPAETENPAPIEPRIVVNTNLGRSFRLAMAEAAQRPSAPGLPSPRLTNDGPGTTAPPPDEAEGR